MAMSIHAVSPVLISVICPTGVTAPWSVSPVRMRTARSRSTTKILPSPTSPVRPPSQRASIAGCTNSSETAISKRTFSDRPIFTVVPRYVSTRSSSPPWPWTRLIETPRTSAR